MLRMDDIEAHLLRFDEIDLGQQFPAAALLEVLDRGYVDRGTQAPGKIPDDAHRAGVPQLNEIDQPATSGQLPLQPGRIQPDP